MMLNRNRKLSHALQRKRLSVRLKHKVNSRRHVQFLQESTASDSEAEK